MFIPPAPIGRAGNVPVGIRIRPALFAVPDCALSVVFVDLVCLDRYDEDESPRSVQCLTPLLFFSRYF